MPLKFIQLTQTIWLVSIFPIHPLSMLLVMYLRNVSSRANNCITSSDTAMPGQVVCQEINLARFVVNPETEGL